MENIRQHRKTPKVPFVLRKKALSNNWLLDEKGAGVNNPQKSFLF